MIWHYIFFREIIFTKICVLVTKKRKQTAAAVWKTSTNSWPKVNKPEVLCSCLKLILIFREIINFTKKNYIWRRIFYQPTFYSPLIIPYNYYWMWYIIEEKENFFVKSFSRKFTLKKKKEAIVLFIEEEKKTFFFYSFFKKKQQQPMWNECDFLNVFEVWAKKTKNTFSPLQFSTMHIPIFFFLTMAWVFIATVQLL